MTSSSIDYAGTYFKYAQLTKIYGTLDHQILKTMWDDIEVNLCPVTSDLGGGMYIHLGLGCTAAEYTSVGLAPYIRPRHPGVVDIQVGIVQHAVTHIYEDHKKATIFFGRPSTSRRRPFARLLRQLWRIF